jgi:hypothetical protein
MFWNFTLNTEFLLAGLDGSGAHISWVHYHGMQGVGWLESFDKLGYSAIGSGGPHANILLSLNGQHRDLPVAQTLFNAYAAKVSAEVAPGVGAATDIAVISGKGDVAFLSEDSIKKLGDLRTRTLAQKPPQTDLEDACAELKAPK